MCPPRRPSSFQHSKSDGTTDTLGVICNRWACWPHITVRESLKKLYGFCSDYPGIRHPGHPEAKLREYFSQRAGPPWSHFRSFSAFLTTRTKHISLPFNHLHTLLRKHRDAHPPGFWRAGPHQKGQQERSSISPLVCPDFPELRRESRRRATCLPRSARVTRHFPSKHRSPVTEHRPQITDHAYIHQSPATTHLLL